MSVPDEPKGGEPKRFQFQKKVDTDWKRKVEMEKRKFAGDPAAKGAAPTPPPPPAKPASAKPAAPEAPPAPEEPKPSARRGVDMAFMAVLQQLADQAALFMGLVPGYPERNCEQSLATIEMLRALQDKTKGNLSTEESKALTGVVYELQMRYVQTCGGGKA